MNKALKANGNSWQLYINKPLADILGITKENYVVSLSVRDKIVCMQLHNSDITNTGLLIKKLIRRGAGFGLNMSRPLLEVLDINPELDTVDIDVCDNKLIIKKS